MVIKIWLEHSTGSPAPAEKLADGTARMFSGRDHWFEDVTDRPSPTITMRPLEVVIECVEG